MMRVTQCSHVHRNRHETETEQSYVYVRAKYVLHIITDATRACRHEEIVFIKEKSSQPRSVEGRLL